MIGAQFFKNLGMEVPKNLAYTVSTYSPLVADASRELIANLQNAETLEEAKAFEEIVLKK